MQNESASPLSGASSLGSSNNSTVGHKQKVALNPFAHLKAGLGSLVKNNLGALLIAILISSVVGIAVTAAFMFAAFLAATPVLAGSSDTSSYLVKLIAALIGAAILTAFVTGYFGSVVTRIIITGARGQKENVGHAFSFVFSRLGKIVLTYLLIVAIIVGGLIVITLAASVTPILSVLLGVVGAIAAIIFSFRWSYVPLVLVDDENPGRPIEVLKRSAELWKKSGGALILYILVWFVVYIILSVFLGGNSSPSTGGTMYNDSSTFLPPQPAATFSLAIGAVLLYSFLSNCFGALVYSGVASIYNDAHEIAGGPAAGTTGSASAPTSPASSSAAPSAAPPSSGPSADGLAAPNVSSGPVAPQPSVSSEDPNQNPSASSSDSDQAA